MPQAKDYLSIGEVADRTGVAPSALRFYESRGLIHSIRAGSNHRRYHRATLRRISIIRVAQTLVPLGIITPTFSGIGKAHRQGVRA